jgi:ArsR family transcriptional regulator
VFLAAYEQNIRRQCCSVLLIFANSFLAVSHMCPTEIEQKRTLLRRYSIFHRLESLLDSGDAIWLFCQLGIMDKKTRARSEARADIIKAMAHPSRLVMLEELSKGERCVCELQELVGADMSTVSKHLSIMKSVGLVVDDKRGTQVFYALRTPCVLNFLDCVENILKTNAKERLALLK